MRQFSTLLTGLVFDMDGVLVDSEPCWYEAMVRVLNRRGAPLSIEDCRRTSGTPIGLLVEQYQGRWPAAVPAASRSAVVEEILSALRDTLSQRRPLVRGTLEALRFLTGHGVTLALASSSPRSLIRFTLDTFGLRPFFAGVVSVDDVQQGKPAPDVYLRALTLLPPPPGITLAVEDSPTGLLSARRAGLSCLSLPAPHHRDHEEVRQSLRILDDLTPLSEPAFWNSLNLRLPD